MWGRIREGDSLEEKMKRSDIRMWERDQRLELLEENTISTASLCVGIFWSNFKASVRTQLADRSTFLKGHPLTLPNSTSDATVTTKDEITGGNCQKHSGTVRWQFLKWTFVLWLEQVMMWADNKKWNAGRNMRKSLKRIDKYFWSGVHFCQRTGYL